MSSLDAALARAYGVELQTAAWLPGEDAEAEALLRAAEEIGQAIGDRPANVAPAGKPWTALPLRTVEPRSADERRAAVERALAWARDVGATWDGIEFPIDADGNAAARASRDLARGDVILSIPRRLMIIDNELGGRDSGRDALAAWLPLEARNPSSRWRAHLEAQPVQLSELPMFHDASDIASLAGTTAHAIAADEAHAVRERYARLPEALRAQLSLADFAWGCAIVMSRAFHAPGSVEPRIALLPIVDFMNHRLGDTTWSYDPRDAMFVVTAERGFSIGDEVHFSYGDRSNTHLFVHYGFTEPSNAVSEASLLFEPAADPVVAVAAHLLWRLPLDAPARVRVACSFDRRFLRALSLARLQAGSVADRARALDAGLGPDGDVPWLGSDVEEAAFSLIAAAARRSLAELDAPPPRATPTAWDRSCAIVRAGERSVLESIIELARAVRGHLHERDPARIRDAADAIGVDEPGSRRLLRQYLRALADSV